MNRVPTPAYPHFRLAFAVAGLAQARRSYGDFFGHPIVAHQFATS